MELDSDGAQSAGQTDTVDRPARADARRNLDALLAAAAAVFARAGVDARVRDIATEAGVGVGTLYRHFPQRSDLIVAVMRREMDACADAAEALAETHGPREALSLWLQRYVDLVATKKGLASALHSGDPAYEPLPIYFEKRLKPALQALLDAGIASGEIRDDVEADELIIAVSGLCTSADGPEKLARARRMVNLLADGLARGATGAPS